MSVPARSATSRAAAGSICCPASATACFTRPLGLPRDLPRDRRARPWLPSAPSTRRSCAVFCSCLYSRRRAIDVGRDEHEHRRRLRALARRPRARRRPAAASSSSAGELPLPPCPCRFGLSSFSARSTDDDAVRSPSSAASAPLRRSTAAVTAAVRGVDALDVERAQLVLDERREIGRQPRHLRVVVADNEVDGIGPPLARSACAPPRRGRAPASEGFEIALTTARANSVARRSSALTSWPKKALGVAARWSRSRRRTPR